MFFVLKGATQMKKMESSRHSIFSARKKRIRRNRRWLGLFLVLIFVWITTSALAKGSEPEMPISITVRAGETLWDIAAACRKPGQDVRRIIDRIRELNHLETSMIYAGDILLLPAR